MKTFNIGRKYDGPVRIPQEALTVSNDHATITIGDDGKWTIEDKDSSNGTYVEVEGKFVRIGKMNIEPTTWIRLGTDNRKGHYFRAWRVLYPDDYSQDFFQLRNINSEYNKVNNKLQRRNNLGKFFPMLLSLAALLSTIGSDNVNLLRFILVCSGALTTAAQFLLTMNLKKKRKMLYRQMICPKCRRHVNDDDIRDGFHPLCKAQ